jgi:hypothetical protein
MSTENHTQQPIHVSTSTGTGIGLLRLCVVDMCVEFALHVPHLPPKYAGTGAGVLSCDHDTTHLPCLTS